MSISAWEDKYSPKRVADLILPDRIKSALQKQVDAGEIQNMLLEGGPGCGKTTAAKAMCAELKCDYILINASEENGIDVLRGRVRAFASNVSISSDANHKVVIFDEADHLNASSTQPALRGFMDEFKSTCRFILTCNYKNRILVPLHSRLSSFSFVFTQDERAKMAGLFMSRCMEILRENAVEFDPAVLASVIKRSFPDFRKILIELQKYSQYGPIDIGILAANTGAKVDTLIGFMKSKDFGSIRKFFVENPDISAAEFFDSLWVSLQKTLEPISVPQAVLILADYLYKSAFSVNQEINLTACCVQLMIDCRFK